MNGYVEIGRGHVWPWQCDQAGHMNVHHYIGLVSDGTFHMRRHLGIPTQPRGDINFIAGAVHMRFLKELRSGGVYVVEGAITEVTERRFELQAEVLDAAAGEIAAHVSVQNICFDTATRRSAPFPDDWRGRIEEMRVAPRTELRPASTGIEIAAPPEHPATPFETARLATHPWHCDQFGHVNVRFYLEWARGTAGFMWREMGMPWPELYTQGYSTAALEQTVRFTRELRAGVPVRIESGVLETTEKTLRFGHRLVNEATGATAALFDVRACMIDRHARRATALPPRLREAAEARRIAWPPAN
jgi:acyl-CoA thioester hydrolase